MKVGAEVSLGMWSWLHTSDLCMIYIFRLRDRVKKLSKVSFCETFIFVDNSHHLAVHVFGSCRFCSLGCHIAYVKVEWTRPPWSPDHPQVASLKNVNAHPSIFEHNVSFYCERPSNCYYSVPFKNLFIAAVEICTASSSSNFLWIARWLIPFSLSLFSLEYGEIFYAKEWQWIWLSLSIKMADVIMIPSVDVYRADELLKSPELTNFWKLQSWRTFEIF